MSRRRRKAANGMGSIRERKDTGTWIVQVTVGTNPDGSPKRLSKGGFLTRSDAEAWRMQTILGRDAGTLILPSETTFAELIDSWEESNPNWSPATVADSPGVLRRHANPVIGETRVTELRPMHVQNLVNRMREKDASEALVHRVLQRVRSCLQHAVRLELVSRNAAANVRVPAPPPRRLTRWTREEAQAVLAECAEDGHPVARYLHVALMTGLRKEELKGLRWEDVNLGECHLTVNQVATGSKMVIQPRAKTEAGHRTVHFDAGTQAVLIRQLEHVEEQRKDVTRWEELDLVFPGPRGRPLQDKLLRQEMERIRKAAKVPRIRPYDTRSTHGSLLAEQGVNPKAISERLGHTDVAFTMQVYVRPVQSEDQAIAELMGGFSAGALQRVATEPVSAVPDSGVVEDVTAE